MPKRKSNVKIVNGKVQLSKEILDIIESWRTEENSEWIDKYLNIILESSNSNTTKIRKHHIIPCFSFKDKNHKNRKETEPLANAIEGNIINLSPYNHIIVHYYLWKIFNNWDSKNGVHQLCGEKITNLSEFQIKKIAEIKENCAVSNDEWLEKRRKSYRDYNKRHIQKRKIYQVEYYRIHKKEIAERDRNRYLKNKEYNYNRNKKYNSQMCYDPINKDYCTMNTLRGRKFRNKEKYKDIKLPNCIIKNDKFIS